jgi:hypothetical protein
MSYFSQDTYLALLSPTASPLDPSGMQQVSQRLIDLHKVVYPRMRKYGLDLHSAYTLLRGESSAAPHNGSALTLTYLRSGSQAAVVEGIMGRDHVNEEQVVARRHPCIELRLTPHGLTVELVVSPDAWYDQQNFAGKLTVAQHRDAFFRALARLGAGYRVGFWGGLHLDDMHLNAGQLPPTRVLNEWFNTFAPGRDWLRVGYWYAPEDSALSADNIANELFNRVRDLSAIYNFVAWTSNNDFHIFYKRAAAAMRA